MKYKPNSTPYFLFPIFIIPVMDSLDRGSLDIHSFVIALIIFVIFYVAMADSFKTLFLKEEGIYTQTWYQKTEKLLVSDINIQSLTKVMLHEKPQTLEVFTKDSKFIIIKNNYDEFDDFLAQLEKRHPIKIREHELSNSPFSQEASKAVTVLFVMVFVVFVVASLMDEYLITAEHLSFESLVSWIIFIYPVSTLVSFLLIRIFNKQTALLEAIIVNFLLAPSIAGLGISINRYINEHSVTSQIEIPVSLYESRKETQVWQVDVNKKLKLPSYIKSTKRFYFDQPENMDTLPKSTQRIIIAQQGKLNDLFILPHDLKKIQMPLTDINSKQ